MIEFFSFSSFKLYCITLIKNCCEIEVASKPQNSNLNELCFPLCRDYQLIFLQDAFWFWTTLFCNIVQSAENYHLLPWGYKSKVMNNISHPSPWMSCYLTVEKEKKLIKICFFTVVLVCFWLPGTIRPSPHIQNAKTYRVKVHWYTCSYWCVLIISTKDCIIFVL